MKHLGTVELETERLILRRFRMEDAKEIYEGFINQEDYLYYFNRVHRTLQDQIDSLVGIDEKYEDPMVYNWLIVEKSENKIVGRAHFFVKDVTECVEVNYAIDKRFEGNGYMSEALKCLIDFSINQLEVKRFQSMCVIENAKSRRVMEKCNMHFEGTLKGYVKLADRYHDVYLYSVINENK